MGPIRRLCLDTNIFIELGEGRNERQRLLYEIVAMQMTRDELFLCTSELTLAELLVLPCRQKNDELIALYESWVSRTNGWLGVGPVTREVLTRAAVVRGAYPRVKLPDAIHLSTALRLECSHFLTADKDIPDDVQIGRDEQHATATAANLKILAPTIDMLEAILESRP